MCLAVPGEVLELILGDSPLAMARVSFAGIVKEVCVACVPEAQVGDYVLVHAGFAISRLDGEAAARIGETFDSLAPSTEETGP